MCARSYVPILVASRSTLSAHIRRYSQTSVHTVGHIHCGGAAACSEAAQAQASNYPPSISPDTPLGRWLAPLTNLVSTLDPESLPAEIHFDAIIKRQVANVCATDVIKGAWAAAPGDESGEKRQVWAHRWVYDFTSRRLKDLGVSRRLQPRVSEFMSLCLRS
ncbi:hypothetical protein EDD17DRAFT_1664090 [Pisolithus thermaeus]|nr:hypothetical protein EDD17DRAFT_1664090 [Pisolithus thermaeus]